jgi:hypothetical protein
LQSQRMGTKTVWGVKRKFGAGSLALYTSAASSLTRPRFYFSLDK